MAAPWAWPFGLSPRVRGNLIGQAGVGRAHRSIPACAGEPVSVVGMAFGGSVYPRVCGGTSLISRSSDSILGLSPRVRGNHAAGHNQQAAEGSIPACAGEPEESIRTRLGDEVYPRVCGGTPCRDLASGRWWGLSPRVRGNRSLPEARRFCPRSIPACAGEPNSMRAPASIIGVYPRVCGGTRPGRRRAGGRIGLSPRVRGNPGAGVGGVRGGGSIPACAGEPALGARLKVLVQVYPRVCGGTDGQAGEWAEIGGLSPRVRGNRQRTRCGGAAEGLSPRVRGNRAAVGSVFSVIGSIPACAGEPRKWR